MKLNPKSSRSKFSMSCKPMTSVRHCLPKLTVVKIFIQSFGYFVFFLFLHPFINFIVNETLMQKITQIKCMPNWKIIRQTSPWNSFTSHPRSPLITRCPNLITTPPFPVSNYYHYIYLFSVFPANWKLNPGTGSDFDSILSTNM